MVIIAPYNVDKNLYCAPGTQHMIKMSTTEYIYKQDMLVHLYVGKNLGIRLNNLLRFELNNSTDFQREQFFFKKVYSSGKAKPTTRSTFDEKLSRFDMGQTAIERNILVEYYYTDKSGNPATIDVEIREKDSVMTATIDFKDSEQRRDFVCPAWLTVPCAE